MATSPRPGVIQLDHPNVYMAAKEAQKDDWVRQSLNIIGNAIQERNRDILYRRALAKAQGLEEPDETTIGDLASSAGSKIAEGASWLKDKWDRLDIRSPFEETLTESNKTETPILETPSEKGSREMIGYTPNPSPIVEQDKYRTQLKAPYRRVVEPNDDLSFGINIDAEEKPSPIIPFRTGEQIPEQIGTKVDFGTSEPTTKLRFPFAMRTNEEMEAQKPVSPVAGAEAPAKQLKAPGRPDSQMEAWSEMYRLRPERAAFDYTRVKDAATKEQNKKEKTQGLLKEVAAEFANLDPTDQAAWAASRDRWLEVDPNLSVFIPETVSQDAWDRVQTQGGLAKNVSPKGEFAQKKYLEDQIKQATWLSQTARAAGKTFDADFYAKKALAMQKQLDGQSGGDEKTPEQWVAEYSTDIEALKKITTKDKAADTTALFSKLSQVIGSGATLDAVKSEISKQLEAEREGKNKANVYSDDELKEQAANYDDIATKLKEDRPKINGAVELLQRGINAGAAGMSSKTLQGDVLAEAEITRYISGDDWNQWKNKIRSKVGLAPSVRASLVADLVNAIVSVFNKEVDAYNNALGTNKYKVKLSRLPLVDKSGKTKPPPGGEVGSSTGKTGGFTVKKRVQ